ncbi:MAG: hypothetical protein ACLUD0_20365 [Eubacterium ramulus]
MQSGKNVDEDAEQIVNEINAVAPHICCWFHAIRLHARKNFLAEHRQMLNARLLVRRRKQRIHFVNGRRNRQDSARDCWRIAIR